MFGDNSRHSPSALREILEGIYSEYNKREYIHPDPLEFLWRYENPADRELVGLIASGLAYGRVSSILKSTEKVLAILGDSPAEYLNSANEKVIRDALGDFKHRFTTSSEMTKYLLSIASLQRQYGLIANLMTKLISNTSYTEALERLTGEILATGGMPRCSMLPRPSLGSACKRLHLFMRWMVRKDDVDPGGWEMLQPCNLMIPLDVHMHRIGLELGFTARKSGDRKTVEEVTEGFRIISPDDPVRYDFALTRLPIWGKHRNPVAGTSD